MIVAFNKQDWISVVEFSWILIVLDNDRNVLGSMVIEMTVLIIMSMYLTRIGWTEDDGSSFKLFLPTPLTLDCSKAG